MKGSKRRRKELHGDATTFDKVAHRFRGGGYLIEGAAAATVDQPMTTPLTDGMPMSLLAVATTVIDNTIDDAINETTTSTIGDKSIIVTIALFDKKSKSYCGGGGGVMPEDTIPNGGGGDTLPRGGADDDDAVVASDDSKHNMILIF